jgi:hypothetical protein
MLTFSLERSRVLVMLVMVMVCMAPVRVRTRAIGRVGRECSLEDAFVANDNTAMVANPLRFVVLSTGGVNDGCTLPTEVDAEQTAVSVPDECSMHAARTVEHM